MEDNLTKEELEQVLSKYFKTLEEMEKINQENLIKQNEEIKTQLLSDEDFRTELLTSIKETGFNVQYSNNLHFWTIVILGTILGCTLMYKFLKIFF